VKKGNKWVGVAPVPNALVINIGDQLQVWRNCCYDSNQMYSASFNQKLEAVTSKLTCLCYYWYPDFSKNQVSTSNQIDSPTAKQKTHNLGYIEDKQLAGASQSPQLHKQTKVVVSSVLSQMLQEAENWHH
jgi:hypothetical protein